MGSDAMNAKLLGHAKFKSYNVQEKKKAFAYQQWRHIILIILIAEGKTKTKMEDEGYVCFRTFCYFDQFYL